MSDIDTSGITPAMVRVAKSLKGSKKRYTAQRNDFIAKMKKSGSGRTIEWELGPLIRTEVRAGLEELIIPNSKSKTTIEQRLAWWIDKTQSRMEFIGGESRSTSQAGNLVEDILNRVELGFYSDLMTARKYES